MKFRVEFWKIIFLNEEHFFCELFLIKIKKKRKIHISFEISSEIIVLNSFK